MAALEAVEEDARKRTLAGAELADYLKGLSDELKDLRRARTVYGTAALLITLFLATMLMLLVFVSGSPLYLLPEYPAAVLVIALVTGIVVVILALAKGVHRSSVERAKEDTMISVPTLVTEIFKNLGHH